MIGNAPVWATLAPVVRIPTSYDTYTPYGWTWKVIWEVGPGYTQPVAVRGGLLGNDQPALWFQVDPDQPATTTPLLDPRHPNHGSVLGDNWAEWGTYVFFPVAGRYFIEATWPQGQWRVIIAVGR